MWLEAVHIRSCFSTDVFYYDQVIVTGNASGSGPSYTLFDDDNQDLLNSPYYCSLGGHEAAFREAFIEPQYLPESFSDQVPFNLNLTDWELALGVDYDNGQDIWSSSDFWACLIVSCYQGDTDEDVDPDGWGEGPPAQDPYVTLGAHHHDADNAAVIYLETILNERLAYWSEGQVVATR